MGEPHCHGPDCPLPEPEAPVCKPCGTGKAAAVLGMLRDRTYAAQVRGLGGRAGVGALPIGDIHVLRGGHTPSHASQIQFKGWMKSDFMRVGARMVLSACEGRDMRSGAPVPIERGTVVTTATIPLDVRRSLMQTRGRQLYATGFYDPAGTALSGADLWVGNFRVFANGAEGTWMFLVKRTPMDHPFWISVDCIEAPWTDVINYSAPSVSVSGVRRAEIVRRPGVGLVVKNFAG